MEREYVGIDFHRRRSVIVRMNGAGEKLSTIRVANDPLTIAAAVAEAGPDPEVVLEATYGWYWVVDLLQANGVRVHLANPQGLNWGQRRVKNDERDAIDLADMLRLGGCPRRGLHLRRSGSCASWSATAPSSWRSVPGSRRRCTP
jgi:transposase